MKYKNKNKTKKYKGGEVDKMLNDDFIINNLRKILNGRPTKYTFDIKKEMNYGINNFLIFIKNKDEKIEKYNPDDDPCVSFSVLHLKDGLSILLNSINKCAPISGYGNFILNSFKEFAAEFNYRSVVIGSDASVLQFEFNGIKKKYIEINLPYLNILSTGESWYNKMGFYATENAEQTQDNLHKIRQDIQDIDDSEKIINQIYETIKMYRRKIPKCYQLISSYGKFRELYNANYITLF